MLDHAKTVRSFFPNRLFDGDGVTWRSPGTYNTTLASMAPTYRQFSYAQDQEDLWLYENWFYGVSNGVIMESGALDGIMYSTSYLFEKFAQWTVIHVEADPRNFYRLARNRLEAINIHAALCSEARTLHFTNDKGSEVQGFVEFMTPMFLRKFHNKIYKNITKLEDLATVQCVQAKKLLQELSVDHIDVWVLDTEGAELSVLEGTDFSRVHINTIVMECDGSDLMKDQEKIALLSRNGYGCEYVKRNCFCRHSSFQPSAAPSGVDLQYTGERNVQKRIE